MRNDLINKDKFIQRIQRGKNQLLVKDLQKNFREGGTFQERRRFTIHPGIAGGGTNNLIEFQKNYLGRFSSLLDDNSETSEKTDKKNKDNKNSNSNGNITTNIRKARNSLFSPGFNFGRLVKQKEEINKDKGDNNSNNNSAKKENKFISQTREKSNKSLLSNQSILSDKRLAEMQIDEKSEKSEISDDDKDKDKEKEFKGLKICQEKNFDYISIGNNKVNNINNGAPLQFRILGNEKAILNTLQKLLERVRKRKERLNEKKNRDKNKKFK